MAKKKKPKKVKQLYDENGNWIEERGRIKGLLRKAFRLSPQHRETLQEARVELPPKLKKDGNPGKKNQVRYQCAICRELFQQTRVQVDHIETVVPLWKLEKDMLYDGDDGLIRRIMCKKSNLQALCSTPLKLNDGKSSCHKSKTDEEKFLRTQLQKKGITPALDNYEDWIRILKKDFKIHLVEKEEERLAKEERKRLKEERKRLKELKNKGK